MTAIGLMASVTAHCSRCGSRVTPLPEQLMGGHPVYCGAKCRVRSSVERKAVRNGRRCAACGGPATVRMFGLEICLSCRGVAWQTCWRKRPHDADPGELVAQDGVLMRSYRCPLCPFWHMTKATSSPRADFLAAQVPLARLFAEVSFDIDRYRNRRPIGKEGQP